MVDKFQSSIDKLTKAIIKVGYLCNNDCVFCHSSDLRGEKTLSHEEIFEKIRKAKRLGVRYILFSGGEPLLLRDIDKIFEFALSLKMYSGVITNGRLLSNREFLHYLYTKGLRYVYMSFVGSNSHLNHIITMRDTFAQQMGGILNLQNYKDIFLTINIPIIQQNIYDLVNIVRLLTRIGVSRIKLSVIEPKGRAFREYQRVVPPLGLTSYVIRKVIKGIEEIGLKIGIYHDGLPYCLSPDYSKYNRDMYSENILYMSESFEDRLYRVDYGNMEYVPGVCDQCLKRKLCRGIYRGYIENNDTPVLPIRRQKTVVPIKTPVSLNEEKNYEINIGKLCNNACIFCANGKVSKEEFNFIGYDKIEREIKKAYRDGFNSLGFLGGEITIHPDVLKIIKTAKKVGFKRIAICTNGRRLSDKEFTEKLIRSGVTRFMISIHSHREEVENYLNGRKNSYKEKIEGIKNLVELSKRYRISHGISLNTCIHKLNYKELVDFCIFFKELGISDFRFNFIRPENKAEYDKKIIPTLTEVRDYIQRLIEWNEREGNVSIAIGDIPFCLLPERILTDLRLLKKYIGEFRDFDTFVTTFKGKTDENFVERFSWRDRKSNHLKQKSPVCNKCIFDSLCEGLFKNYINIYSIKEIKRPIKSLPQT